MAEKEMYDYLSAATPDYSTTTLSLEPHNVLTERGSKNQTIHVADDGSEERIALSSTSVFFASLVWVTLSPEDAGTIIDFFHDAAKGNGMARTFKWEHPTDGHTYVVRFASDIGRTIKPANLHGVAEIQLKVLGRI